MNIENEINKLRCKLQKLAVLVNNCCNNIEPLVKVQSLSLPGAIFENKFVGSTFNNNEENILEIDYVLQMPVDNYLDLLVETIGGSYNIDVQVDKSGSTYNITLTGANECIKYTKISIQDINSPFKTSKKQKTPGVFLDYYWSNVENC